MRHVRLVMCLVIVSVVGLLLVACGADDPVEERTGIGAQGGSLEADGVLLVIPAGALETETDIRIQAVDAPPEADWLALGPFVRIEPSGLVLAKAASLTITASEALLPGGRSLDEASLVTGAELSSRFEALESQRDGDAFSAPIGEFAIFGVAIPADEAD